MKEDMIQVPDFGPAVPEAVAAHAKEIIASIIDGSFNPFTGPIKDQSGKITVPDGKEMSHEELAAMNYYIEGVDGTIPK